MRWGRYGSWSSMPAAPLQARRCPPTSPRPRPRPTCGRAPTRAVQRNRNRSSRESDEMSHATEQAGEDMTQTRPIPIVACLAGDGIGPEVMAEAGRVIDGASELFGIRVRQVHLPFGGEAIDRYG